jgi:hypothetical protein
MRCKNIIYIFLTGCLLLSFPLAAQEVRANDTVTVSKKSKRTSIAEFFKQSKWEFHARTFFMATVNEGELKDDYAMAQGAGIGLITKPIKGLQFGMSGYFNFNLFSSDIADPDSITGQRNRYEIGQFDINDPGNRFKMLRLEEIYIKYSISKSNITVGRMELNTPFMNPQDGRMRPTVESAVWVNVKESEKIGLSGGYIFGISPRSTFDWYKVQSSVGIYPQGLNTDGSKSNYRDSIKSAGFLMGNLYYKPVKNITINIWNGMFLNIMNTLLVDFKSEQHLKKKPVTFYQGLMYIRQDAIKDGGNPEPSKTYINKNAASNAISSQIGMKYKMLNANINYTHIFSTGRYLMPREWGRDPFYTFMPRERNEGSGNVHAVSSNFTVILAKEKLKTTLSYGFYKLPDPTDVRLNKYGMPSYHQLNLASSYTFTNILKGLEIRMLIASKFNANNNFEQPKYIYNKVNMVNFNLIVDLRI